MVLASSECFSILIAVVVSSRVIFLVSKLDVWRQLKRTRTSTGCTSSSIPKLWEWTLTCRSTRLRSTPGLGLLPALQDESERVTMAMAARSELRRSLQHSLPLDRRFPWTEDTTLSPPSTSVHSLCKSGYCLIDGF